MRAPEIGCSIGNSPGFAPLRILSVNEAARLYNSRRCRRRKLLPVKLSIDDTLEWLPEYPAWKDVTIRRLLNMTSGIPNYSETEWISQVWATEPMRALTLKELADAAYPSARIGSGREHAPQQRGGMRLSLPAAVVQ